MRTSVVLVTRALRNVRVWCLFCYRSIDGPVIRSSISPCPYCGSTESKLQTDPLATKLDR